MNFQTCQRISGDAMKMPARNPILIQSMNGSAPLVNCRWPPDRSTSCIGRMMKSKIFVMKMNAMTQPAIRE